MSRRGLLDRRAFVAGSVGACLVASRSGAASEPRVFVGTYADKGGAGLVALVPDGRSWRPGSVVEGCRDASFGVRSPRTGVRYFVGERTDGAVEAYDPAWRRTASSSSGGAGPCHVALSPDGRLLAVANYGDGRVCLVGLDDGGTGPLGAPAPLRRPPVGGAGVAKAEPHAHWVGFSRDGGRLHSVDLGLDAVFAYDVASSGEVSGAKVAYRATPGSGPRHLARHPRLPIAYLVAETANLVTVLREYPDGTFAALQVASTLPVGFRRYSAAGHLALDRSGSRLHVSNRGHDTIATFAVLPDGRLGDARHVPCGGHWPRMFLLVEDRRTLLVANERSGVVAVLPLGPGGFPDRPHGIVHVPGAAFLTL